MGLEQVVNKTISTWKLSDSVAPLCYEFFSPQDALLANSLSVRVVLAHKLGVFLYMVGVIPRTLPDGEVKHIGPQIQDLSLLGYSYFTHVEKRTSSESVTVDKPFNRLMMSIVKQNTRKAGPSVEDLIDEIGSHPLIVQRYGRPVSYDDVLPLEDAIRKYATGQREIITPDGERLRILSPLDFWVLGPAVIKLGTDKRLYRLWERAGADWLNLINAAGRQRRVSSYLVYGLIDYLMKEGLYGDVQRAVSESDAENYLGIHAKLDGRKVKFIKISPLQSSELVSPGVVVMAHKSAPSYNEFRAFVDPERQRFIQFRNNALEEARKAPIGLDRLVRIAEGVGIRTAKGKSIEQRVIEVLGREVPELVGRLDPSDTKLYYGLKKYLEEGGEPVRQVLTEPLEQAILEAHPDYDINILRVQRIVHAQASAIINALVRYGVETHADLDALVSSGNIDRVKGLVSVDPKQRSMYNHFVAALQKAGYKQPSTTAHEQAATG